MLFIGKAQEKTPVFSTERRRNEKTGGTYPWLVRSTAMVNHFYVYCVDRDFGPFFLLDLQKVSHDCAIGEDAFHHVVRPIEVDGQRASALRFGDERVQALFAVLAVSLQLRGFTNQEIACPAGTTAGPRPSQLHCRPDDLRPAAAPSSRNHRTYSAQSPLSTDT